MSEHGFPLAFKWKVVAAVDVAVGLIMAWWIIHYAYAHDWAAVALWCASGAFYYWFGVRSHLRWYRGELAKDG